MAACKHVHFLRSKRQTYDKSYPHGQHALYKNNAVLKAMVKMKCISHNLIKLWFYCDCLLCLTHQNPCWTREWGSLTQSVPPALHQVYFRKIQNGIVKPDTLTNFGNVLMK